MSTAMYVEIPPSVPLWCECPTCGREGCSGDCDWSGPPEDDDEIGGSSIDIDEDDSDDSDGSDDSNGSDQMTAKTKARRGGGGQDIGERRA